MNVGKTHALTVVALVVVGGALGWLLEVALTAGGRPSVTPPISFGAVLLVIAIAVVVLAIPVRRVAKGRKHPDGTPATVDPFYATRVLALAKSSIWVGAFLTGGTAAVLGYELSRPSLNGSALLPMILALVASAALLVAGIVAEEMCRIPPSDDDPRPDDDGPLPLPGGHGG